jgi:beta-lactamase superfamily II metal-dependent hydrolase
MPNDNPFLDYELREQGPYGPLPSRLYGVVDRVDPLETESTHVAPEARPGQRVEFDCVDADWFDRFGLELARGADLWTDVPIYALEVELTQGLGAFTGLLPALEASGTWLELFLSSRTDDLTAALYWNLFQDKPDLVNLASVSPVTQLQLLASLRRSFWFTGMRNATVDELDNALAAMSVDGVAVYDVGQGSCGAVVRRHGISYRVQAYLDFGCGVLGNAHTVSPLLRRVCLPLGAPVVLSHWDSDHWALAQRLTAQKDEAAGRTWIAPRQRVGPRHKAFARRVGRLGSLLFWPKGLASRQFGSVTIERCTGNSRNDSGLAVTVEPHTSAEKVLVPGDARYGVVPCASAKQFDAIVVTHHGGTGGSRSVPGCSSSAGKERAIYSFGKGNKYGHPFKASRRGHDAAGWLHRGMSAPPDLVRQTSSIRPALGHVVYPFGPAWSVPVPVACAAGRSCPFGSSGVPCSQDLVQQ